MGESAPSLFLVHFPLSSQESDTQQSDKDGPINKRLRAEVGNPYKWTELSYLTPTVSFPANTTTEQQHHQTTKDPLIPTSNKRDAFVDTNTEIQLKKKNTLHGFVWMCVSVCVCWSTGVCTLYNKLLPKDMIMWCGFDKKKKKPTGVLPRFLSHWLCGYPFSLLETSTRCSPTAHYQLDNIHLSGTYYTWKAAFCVHVNSFAPSEAFRTCD